MRESKIVTWNEWRRNGKGKLVQIACARQSERGLGFGVRGQGSGVRGQGSGVRSPGLVYVTYACVFLGSVTMCRWNKLTLPYHATLQPAVGGWAWNCYIFNTGHKFLLVVNAAGLPESPFNASRLHGVTYFRKQQFLDAPKSQPGPSLCIGMAHVWCPAPIHSDLLNTYGSCLVSNYYTQWCIQNLWLMFGVQLL